MFFKKKDQQNEYTKASFELNKSGNNFKSAVERIVFEELMPSDNKAVILVGNLKNSEPIIVNFANLEIDEANKNIAFLSGATYALEGEIIKLREKVYLFAKKQEFLDGTLEKFIKEDIK